MSARADRIGLRLSAPTPFVVGFALCIFGVAAFWPTFVGLARIWHESADYGHGILVAAISVGWLVVLRRRIESVVVRPMPLAVPALALAILAWVIAYRANSEIVQELLAPAAILMAVLAALGPAVARLVMLPVAYLYLAVPIWDQLLPLLQTTTTNVAEGVLHLLRVPTVVESHSVTIPEGRFAIVEGCSGKRYLLVALAFAALLGPLRGLRAGRAAILIAASAALALVANWFRVITIIYAGHVSNMEHYLVAEEHITFGWLVFVPLLLAIVFVARRLDRGHGPAPAVTEAGDAATNTAAASAGRAAWVWPAVWLAIPMVAVATRSDATPNTARLGQLPVMVGEWQGPIPANPSWEPLYISPVDERRAAYTSLAGDVEIYLNLYGPQTQGHELIFFRNSVTPPERFSAVRALPQRDDIATIVAEDVAGRHWVIAQTYSVYGRVTRSPALAQLYYGMNAVWRPVPSGTIALAAACVPDCAQAEERVQRFWSEHGRTLTNLIPTTL